MFYFLQQKRKSKKLSLVLIAALSLLLRSATAQSTDCGGDWLEALESKMLGSYSSEYTVDKTKGRTFMLPSNKEVAYTFKFDASYTYDIILLADPSARASGIEIRDRMNKKLQFSKVYRKKNSNIVVLTFDPGYDEEYKVVVKSIYAYMQTSCAQVLIMMQEKKAAGDDDGGVEKVKKKVKKKEPQQVMGHPKP